MPSASLLTRNTRNTRNTVAAAVVGKIRPVISISMDGQEGAYLRSYTTRDEVRGIVRITAPQDRRFEEIYITLEGKSKASSEARSTMTYVDNAGTTAATNPRARGYHTFLKIRQPIEPDLYPHPRIAERGHAYDFPFTFTIPEQLPITDCRHTIANEQIKQEHKRLPPSLGDPSQAGDAQGLLDDLAPHMSKISYAVRVRVTTPHPSDGREVTLVDGKHKIRLVPEVHELPPVNVEDNCDDNALRTERHIKRGTFKGRLGTVVAQTNQPPTLRLPSPRDVTHGPITTSVTLTLRFDPVRPDSRPPQLETVSNRLRVSTFYSTRPMEDFPVRTRALYSSVRGLFAESMKLSSRCISEVQWTRHDSRQHPEGRTQSMIPPDSSTPRASSAYSGGPYYLSKILIPVSLPKHKAWVPTFHSCLVSRVYQLELDLSVKTPNTSLVNPVLHLRVPVQISAAGGPFRTSAPLSSVAEVEAIFQPRSTTTVPTGGFPNYIDELPPDIDGSPQRGTLGARPNNVRPPGELVEAPPGYSFLVGANYGSPVRIPQPFGFPPSRA